MIDNAPNQYKTEAVLSQKDIEAIDDDRIARNKVFQKPKSRHKDFPEPHPKDLIKRHGPTDSDEGWKHHSKRKLGAQGRIKG